MIGMRSSSPMTARTDGSGRQEGRRLACLAGATAAGGGGDCAGELRVGELGTAGLKLSGLALSGLVESGLEIGYAPFCVGGCLGVNRGIRSGPLHGPSARSTYGRESAGSSSSGARAAAFAGRERWISSMNPHIPDVFAAPADVRLVHVQVLKLRKSQLISPTSRESSKT
jgi:hypothetical protein